MDTKLTLTFSYSDGKLRAEWPAQQDVYGYALTVLDEAGAVVFSTQIRREDYAPPVIVESAAFQPQPDATYTAEASIIGPPSDRQSVAAITLEQPVLAFAATATGGSFTWQTQARATGYNLQILQGEAVTLTRENQAAPPLPVAPTDGLAEDTDYTAMLRARAGNAFGPWSAPVAFRLFSARSMLAALQQRLEANRPAPDSVALNATTLPAGLAGSPDRILTLIGNALSTQDLAIKVGAGPALSEDGSQLTLAGTAQVLNTADTPVSLVFGATGDRLLNLTLRADPPAGWEFSQSFPAQQLGLMDLWDVAQPHWLLASDAHAEDGVFFPLGAGLNFLATLRVADDLIPADTEGAQVQSLEFGGPIGSGPAGVEFHFRGKQPLGDLTLKPLGWPAMTLKGGTLLLDSVPPAPGEEGNTNNFRIAGTISFSYGDLPFALDIPTREPQPLTARLDSGGASFINFQALVSAIPGTSVGQNLPATLQGLAGIGMRRMEWYFYPAQDGPTISTVESGTDTAWDVTIFRLSRPTLTVNSFISPNGPTQVMRSDQLIIGARLGIDGTEFDVTLAVPYQGDWVLKVTNAQPGLQNLGTFMGQTSAQLLAALPAPIQGMGNFAPTEVRIGFDPFAPSLRFVAFTIEQIAKWVIVADVVEVDHWHIEMEFGRNGADWEADSLLEGDIILASHPVHVTMPIPPGASGWTLDFAQEPLNIPGFGDLLTLIGAQETANLLPQGVRELGNLTVTQLAINFDPTASTNPIRRIVFQINTPSPWNLIPDDNLVINSLEAGINVSLVGGSYVAAGFVRGILTVIGTSVYMQAQRFQPTAPWLFVLKTVRVIHIPGLGELAAWMLPESMLAYVPVSFMPFSQGLDLTGFDMEFDLTNANLNKIQFLVRNSEAWEVITGYLTLDDVFVQANITNPLAADPGLVATIQGTLLLGNLGITLSAAKATRDAAWVFAATIEPNSVLDFEAFFTQVTPTIAIPYDYGFPRSITIVEGSTSVTPAESTFHFSIATQFDWQFQFALATLRINALGAALDVQAPQDGKRPYTFQATGSFSFAGITATLGFVATSQQDGALYRFQAALTPENAAGLSVATLADSLTTGNGQGTPYASLSLPDGVGIGFAEAQLRLTLAHGANADITKNTFILFGRAKQYGAAGFLAFQKDANTWGYYVGAALAEGFTFASITPALASVDGILHVRQAGFGIASTDIPSVQQLVKDLPEFSTVVALDPAGSPAPLKAGANFYGTLEFSGTLFGNVPKVLSGVERGPSITVYAFIARAPGQSLFQATLGNFNLTDALHFNTITLQYQPKDPQDANAEDKLGLLGDMVVTVDSNPYTFQSMLTVTNSKATFHLETASQLPNPLGMFNILMKRLTLDVQYLFGETTSLSLSLSAQVGFGAPNPQGVQPIVLAGNLLFVDGTPKISEIALVQPLSVDDFMTTVLPANLWPTGWLKITFTSGRMYYSLVAGTYFEKTYTTGFNLDTTIDVWDHVFHITAQVQSQGVTIQGTTSGAIDLYLAQLTDQAFDLNTSPALFITTVGQNMRFGFDAGVVLFKHNVGTAALSFAPAATRFEGTFTYNGKILDTQNPHITFAWSKDRGFEILDWDLSLLSAAYDFAKKIEELSAQFSSGSGCGRLVGMAFDKAVTNVYSVAIDRSDTSAPLAQDKSTYRIPLKVTVKVQVAGQTIIERSIPLPVVIQAPGEITWETFLSTLGSTVVNSADAVVQEILEHPDQFAAFIGAAGLKKLASTTVSSLLCREVNSPEVQAEAETSVAEEATASETAAEGAEGAAAAAEGAADAAAAAAAAAEAGVAVETIGGIVAVLAGLVAGLLSLFGVSKSPEQRQAEANQQRAQEAHDRAVQAVKNKLRIASVTLTNPADTTLRADWGQVPGAGVTYEITIDKAGQRLTSQAPTTAGYALTDERVEPGFTYTANVRAVLRHGNDTYQGEWQSASLTVAAIPAPTSLALEQVEQTIRLAWQPGAADTERYEVRVLDEQGVLLNPQPAITVGATGATITGLTAGARYIFEVRGIKGSVKSRWTRSPAVLFSSQAAPQQVAVSWTLAGQDAALQVTWQDTQTGADYQVQMFDEHSVLLNPQPIVTRTGMAADVTGAVLQVGKTYQVRVATVKDGQQVWSQLVSIALLVQPQATITGFVFDQASGKVVISFNPASSVATGAVSYLAQLLSGEGQNLQPFGTPTPIPADATATTFSAALDATGAPAGPVQGQVRALSDNPAVTPGAWAIFGQALTKLAMPAIPTAAYDRASQEVGVTLSGLITGADGYQAQFLDHSGAPVGTPTSSSTQEIKLAVGGLNAGAYRVQARARAVGAIDSDWQPSDAAAPLTVLAAPVVGATAYDSASKLATVSWSNVAGVSVYEAQLVVDATPLDTPSRVGVTDPPPPTPDTTLAVPDDLPAGAVRAQVRASATDPRTIDSAWALSPQALPRAGAVSITGLSYDPAQNRINVTWQEVADAASYLVQLLADATPIGTPETTTPQPGQVEFGQSFAFDTHNPAGTVQARAMALPRSPQTLPGPWTLSTQTLTRLAAPAITTLHYSVAQNQVTVSGPVLTGAASYRVQLLAGATPIGTPETTTPQTGQTEFSQILAVGDEAPAGPLGAQALAVPADAGQLPSLWAPSAQTLTRLEAPQVAQVAATDGALSTTLAAVVAGAGGYEAQLFHANNVPASPLASVSADVLVVPIDTTGVPAATYTLQVRSAGVENTAVTSAWRSAPQPVVLLPQATISAVTYAGGQVAVEWGAVAGATAYDVQLRDPSNAVVKRQRVEPENGQPPATSYPFPAGDLAQGTLYTGYVQARSATGSAAWSASVAVLVLDPPGAPMLSYARPTISASWGQVGPAQSYDFELLNADQHPALPLKGGITATATDLDGSGLADGTYYGHVRAVIGERSSAWSAQTAVQIQQLTPQTLAQQLHGEGKTAQQAAPLIKASFAGIGARDMLGVLSAGFPESAGTLAQAAWALSLAGYPQPDAAQALGAANPNASLADIAVALKAGYPAQASLTQATTLRGQGFTAQIGALLLKDADPALTAVQLGILLTMTFADTVATPLQLTQALRNAGYTMNDASDALGQILPLAGLPSTAAALRQVYQPASAEQLAQDLRGQGLSAPRAAAQLKGSFGGTPARDMLTLMQAQFLEALATPTQAAWVLQQAGYSQNDAAAAIGAAYSKAPLADVAVALKSGYPAQAVLTSAQNLRQANNSAQSAAQPLRTSHPDLTATQLAIVLTQTFASTVATPADMAPALKNAGYAMNETSAALGAVYPQTSLATIAAVLRQVYQS